MGQNKPLVSIKTITYNHAPYIKECIEGILMQKTDFPFEYIISDDCSTDGTREIVEEYSRKYPDIIKNISPKENIGARENANRIRAACQGKYQASCEGDDYWTDPNKLQKQVSFLEENPDYSLCAGGYMRLEEQSQKKIPVILSVKDNDKNTDYNGYTFTLKEIQKAWLTKTMTVTFRASVLNEFDLSVYKYARDMHLFYHLLKNYKGFYFKEIMGVFRVHQGGVNSMKEGEINNNRRYNYYKELHEINNDEFSRKKYLINVIRLLNYNIYKKYEGNTWKRKIKLFVEALSLMRKFSEFRYIFTVFIPDSFKEKMYQKLNTES